MDIFDIFTALLYIGILAAVFCAADHVMDFLEDRLPALRRFLEEREAHSR